MTQGTNGALQEGVFRAISRRRLLKAAGAAVLAVQTLRSLGAAEEDLKAKAKKNLVLGIDAGVYAGLPLEEAARRIKADGFARVLTAYKFADVRFDALAPDWGAAGKIASCFERNGIKIAAVFGYYNVVDPDAEKRKRGEARLEALLANWKRLGCQVVSTETGTLNRKSEWLEAPENATEEGFAQCRAAVERLARLAEKSGAVLSIEPYWRNVIDSVDRTERLFREVASPALRLVMDPCNYFRKEDLPRMQPMLEDMFKRLGDRIVVAHAKDVKASAGGTDLPAAGLGVLDYPLYLRLLARLDREMPLLIEHLALPDVPRARDYVLGQMEKI
jgi:sugar phosphate isomerase/epimerase